MKRAVLFMAYMLASVTMLAEVNDYIPFVELGKKWRVITMETQLQPQDRLPLFQRPVFDIDTTQKYFCHFEQYEMSGEVERDGKTYTKTFRIDDIVCISQKTGLYREENRRVYVYDEKADRELLMYDFSLKEGDTFTYEYGFDQPLKCKVLKQGWLDNGPEIVLSRTLTSADTMETKYRRLRTWTIGRDNGSGKYDEFATWVEGVGVLEEMFSLFDRDNGKSYLAYVERSSPDYWENGFLPFSFCNINDEFGQVFGCNLPTGAENTEINERRHHQLTYELEGDRLHVYGDVYIQCGPNNYAYFYEKPTDDPSVHKIEFRIQELEPMMDCMDLHATDFYVSGFDPNLNYIVVDNYGDEHPVINKASQNPSVQHPVDMTSRIVNPRFDNNDVTTGWSGTRLGNWNAKENAEMYSDEYDVFQKIEGLTAGIYAVGVKAFYLAGEELQTAFNHYKANDEASHYAKFYAEANGRQTEVDICSVFDNQVKEPLGCTGEKSLYDEKTERTYYFPKDLDAAERYMHELNCYDNKVLTMVDESLTIGVRKNSMVYGDWSAFDDFTLTYYGQGADAYQMYLDDVWEKNMNKTIIAEGTLYTKNYLDEYCKHRYATTEEEANVALADIQSAHSLLQRNVELWKEWKLAMNRGCALAASPYYAKSEQAQLLARHCGDEAAETEAARNLTNEQLEAEISETEAMINTLYTQEGFANKMLKEGKRWVYSRHRDSALYDENSILHDVEVVTNVTFTIKGDTLIDGRHYAKLYKQEEDQPTVFYMALREEGTTVYSYSGNEEKRLIEFNPYHFRDVQSLSYFEQCYNTIDAVDNISVKNRVFVRHQYKDENGSVILPIGVEGIGYESNGFLGMIFEYTPSDYIRFEACYEDGKCIFRAGDFNAPYDPVINIAYRPFVEEGKVWKVRTPDSGNPVQSVEYYYFDGDTIIDGKTCKQMMCQRYVSPDYPYYNNYLQNPSLSYRGAWYEEDQKVYFYYHFETPFWLYDFSLDANASISSDMTGFPTVLGPRQTGGIKGFKGVHRDVIRMSMDGDSIYITTWLEGVGSVVGPTSSFSNQEEGRYLMSCTVGDEVIYFNDEYEDRATPEALNARKQRIDFTHTIKIKPKSRINREESDACISSSERDVTRPKVKSRTKREAEPSLYGEYSEQQLGINLNPLDDAYEVRIVDETGRVVYEKTVNAGNIVGLNIDISAYAEGRYTVTVENDNESFTGEIDTRATGISDAERLNDNGEMINDNIYNLQGQRISAPRKGLNIVSGRKIFVK